MAFFVPSSTQKATFERRYDSDGKVWHNCISHGELTKKQPYGIIADEYGPVSEALPASGKYILVGVPEATVADGASCWLQIGGYVVDMITVTATITKGHSIITNGANPVADGTTDYTGAAGEFAVNTITTAAGVEIHTVMLVPEQIITV